MPFYLHALYIVSDEEINAVFRAMDQDCNGKIDLKELHTFLKRRGQHRKRKVLKQYIKDIDLDGDGKITLWELTVALRNAQCILENSE